jgi:endonuclease/exonuclease/phosphatase family metal-dependent hydrolase
MRAWKGIATVLTCAALCASHGTTVSGAYAAARKPAQLKVLTWNLYLGADFAPVIAAIAAAPEQTPQAVHDTFADVVQTNFPARAAKMAEIIAREKPDVIALQEVALWRSQPESDVLTGTLLPNARHVEYDFAKILLAELKKRKQRYVKRAETIGSDVEAPWLKDDLTIGDLRFTDRDVVLVRSGVQVTKVKSGNFDAALVLPILGGVPVERTYTVVDAKVKGRKVRVVAAHLESDDLTVRTAQAQELAAGPLVTTRPLVLLGDFNTDAALTTPEATYTALIGAGLTEAWPATGNASPGLTWGQQPLLDNAISTATQRLDLVFTRGTGPVFEMQILGAAPSDKTPGGLWPSDHFGVSAGIELQ